MVVLDLGYRILVHVPLKFAEVAGMAFFPLLFTGARVIRLRPILVVLIRLLVIPILVWEVQFLEHFQGILFPSSDSLRLMVPVMEDYREVLGEEHLREGKFKLEDSLNELVIC